MKNILKGNKISKSHSTYNKLAGEIIKVLKKYPEISKISLGIIKQDHARNRRIKIGLDKGNVRITCREIDSIQYIYIFGVGTDFVENKLKNYFKNFLEIN